MRPSWSVNVDDLPGHRVIQRQLPMNVCFVKKTFLADEKGCGVRMDRVVGCCGTKRRWNRKGHGGAGCSSMIQYAMEVLHVGYHSG